MNPQGGEGNQSSPPTTAPIAESNVGVASNPLGGVVDAANEAAAAQTTAPLPNSVGSIQPIQERFIDQFGDPGLKPPPAPESNSAAVNPTSPDLASVLGGLDAASPAAQEGSAIVSEMLPPAETPAPEVTAALQPEETQKDPKQEIIEGVNNVQNAWDGLKAAINKVTS